ncbi:efflux RND transporter periplasmic adaptor subunit [Varunaivibrio sulfuroxidans]|uniref:RND family efflux transporter MFP subunit n=1 Tax=Varunaivibrio sulfuroxidans TaxID=1773489 RepID=A0A4R3J4V5_9PROT|nr:efflux RND transporter periplasmic adaptor subunit [Varunaivibrio sulfuroxidans]TCS60337.1 RND family efflux transporter MFP subunit [Varunaivibrio sulfuroxidans]WES30975.1 efflux RND transporter periplasmic adaptor subunit [Varunaivibrio sulfuroxidans]
MTPWLQTPRLKAVAILAIFAAPAFAAAQIAPQAAWGQENKVAPQATPTVSDGVDSNAGVASNSVPSPTYTVTLRTVDDRKSVFATVQSKDVASARTRIGGTIVELKANEGNLVKAGQVLARVVDKKLALRLQALDAEVRSLDSQRTLARTALGRAKKLWSSGTIPKARLDEATTNLDVVNQQWAAAQAQRRVVIEQQSEGDVLAPADGRILKVDLTKGAVVLPGETVATLTASAYILRLQVPERHARYIKVGDVVMVAERGLESLTPDAEKYLRRGYVRQVYPEIKQGRVSADVEVAGLEGFFIGERIRVYISTGKRQTYVIPKAYMFNRFGITFVRLEDGTEVVVQPGLPIDGGVEILSGLKEGDVLVLPGAHE